MADAQAAEAEDDPWVKLGRSLTSSGTAPAPADTGNNDPWVTAGRKIGAQPTSAGPRTPVDLSTPTDNYSPITGIPSIDNFIHGEARGAKDVVATGANLSKWVNDRVPALAGLDRLTGLSPEPMVNQLAADRENFDASPAGDSYVGSGGRMVGQALATAPLLGPVNNLAAAGLRTVGSVLPEAGPVVSAAGRAVSRAVQGGVVGGTYGAATSGGNDESLGENIASGAKIGAVAGPVVGAVVDAATPTVSRTIANLATIARDKFGMNIPAPLMSENSLVRTTYDQSGKLPGSGAGASRAELDQKWHEAYDKEMGGRGSATFADPLVMSENANRITGVMDTIGRRTTIDTNTDPHLLNDLADIEARAHSGQIPLAQGGLRSIDANIASVINSATAGGDKIPGDVYQKMVQTNSPLDLASSHGDVHTQNFNQQIMDALDRAHIRAATPDDQAALAKARYQYRVMKTVEPLAAKSTDGTIPPASLMTNVTAQSRRFDPSTGGIAYTGGGNVGDLARIGKQFLSSPPNSGTADRMIINGIMGGGGLLQTGAVGVGALNPLSLAAMPAGLVVNRMAQSALRSNWLAERAIRGAQ